MPRPYRIELAVYDDEGQRKRMKRFVCPEGLVVTASNLTRIGTWLIDAINAFDAAEQTDVEETLD